jgi:hypothetical protein
MATHAASVAPAVRPPHWTDYLKFIGHLLLAPVLGALLSVGSGGITPTIALQLAVVTAGSAIVFIAENNLTGVWAYTKSICAWLIAVLTAALPFAIDGWAGVQAGAPVILAAAAGALGVGVLPNTGAASLADVVRDTLEQVQRLTAALPDGTSPPVGAAWGTQVRGSHAPAQPVVQPTVQVSGQPPVTAGARTATSATDTGTLEPVRARGRQGYLES